MRSIAINVLSVIAGILLTAGTLEFARTMELRIPDGSSWVLLLLGGLLALGVLRLMAARGA